MLSFLNNHPFAVEAFFEYSLVLTYAIPKEDIQTMIPVCLELDTFKDQWAFVTVALVQTQNLRPKGLSSFFGNNFFLIGYRIFVRYTTNAGKRLRGLYILKSETDSRKMNFLGAVFTKYQYTFTDITCTTKGTTRQITSKKSNLDIVVDADQKNNSLPMLSPFADWKEARRFAGPLPFTFSYDSTTKEVLIVEGVRENWQPVPVSVLEANVPYFESINLKNFSLANAFIIKDIPYHWKRGRTEIWNG